MSQIVTQVEQAVSHQLQCQWSGQNAQEPHRKPKRRNDPPNKNCIKRGHFRTLTTSPPIMPRKPCKGKKGGKRQAVWKTTGWTARGALNIPPRMCRMIGVGLLCPSPIPRLPNENAQVAFLLSASTPVNGLGSRCVRRQTKRKDSGGWRRPSRLPGNVVISSDAETHACCFRTCLMHRMSNSR